MATYYHTIIAASSVAAAGYCGASGLLPEGIRGPTQSKGGVNRSFRPVEGWIAGFNFTKAPDGSLRLPITTRARWGHLIRTHTCATNLKPFNDSNPINRKDVPTGDRGGGGGGGPGRGPQPGSGGGGGGWGAAPAVPQHGDGDGEQRQCQQRQQQQIGRGGVEVYD